MSWALVNGALCRLEDAVIPVLDPGFTSGWTVFETARVSEGTIPLLQVHLDRLRQSAKASLIAFPEELPAEAVRLAALAEGEARLRLTLSGSGFRVLTLESVASQLRGAPVRCVTRLLAADAVLGGAVKHGSRAGWKVAVRRSGMDDVLMVDDEGRFTEGTTCGILAIQDGEVWAAPNDGRILPSITIAVALTLAEQLGWVVNRRGARSTSPLAGLYMCSAIRGMAPVIELDGLSLAGWDPIGASIWKRMCAASAIELASLATSRYR